MTCHPATLSSCHPVTLSPSLPVTLQVGGMRVVTRPRTSESEKPAEKAKEDGEEVSSSCTPLPPPPGISEASLARSSSEAQ